MNKHLLGIAPVAVQGGALAAESLAKMKLCPYCANEPRTQVRDGLCCVECFVCGASTHGFKELKYAEMTWNADLVFEGKCPRSGAG
jgi:hypothetical protein